MGQDQREAVRAVLLVAAHLLDQSIAGAGKSDLVKASGQADTTQMRGQAERVGFGAQAEPDREAEGEHQPDRDRLAVEQAPDPGDRLDRVGEAVAKVEQGALAKAVVGVGGDEAGLGADAGGDGVMTRVAVAGDQRRAMILAPVEESGIVDQAIFDDLGIARTELALVERIEQRGIGDDQGRHVEASDEVLLPGASIAVLPPIALSACDSRVVGTWITGQPRLNRLAARPVTSPTDPPPKARIGVPRLDIAAGKAVDDRGQRGPVLGRFPLGDEDRRLQRDGGEGGAVEGEDAGVGHQR